MVWLGRLQATCRPIPYGGAPATRLQFEPRHSHDNRTRPPDGVCHPHGGRRSLDFRRKEEGARSHGNRAVSQDSFRAAAGTP